MKVADQLRQNIFKAIDALGLQDSVIQLEEQAILIEHPADKSHGDYSTNVAMVVFGKLKQQSQTGDAAQTFQSPRDLAQAIVDQLNGQLRVQQDDQPSDSADLSSELSTNISKIEIAGPGFINFTISNAFLLSKMGLILENRGDVAEKDLNGKKVMIEFTDPNPFKELHIGHLYSNIVGEAIAKSYEALGAEVKRACYQGDVGMHVSKSVWGMKALLPKEFEGKEIDQALAELESLPLNKKVAFLGRSYAHGATAYKDDEEAKKQIQETNYLIFISAQENLEKSSDFEAQVDYKKFAPNFVSDSPEYLEIQKLYSAGRQWSLDYFDSIYSRIGMGFDEFFFESQVGEFGYQIVQEFLKKGVFKESDGAIIFPGSEHGLHDRVFINSLGFPTYEAKELGLAPEKFRRFPYDQSIVITGNEIDEYFKVLMKALEIINPDLQKKTVHMSHGMVRLPEGKMSSRTGKVITAEWLINEARDRIKQHMSSTRADFSQEEIDEIAEVVGLGAIKFAFLKQSIGKDIAFSFEDSLSFSGFSGPYIQYSFVRCQSVLSKANSNKELPIDILRNLKSYSQNQLNNEEIDILRNLYQYSEILSSATTEFEPHQIANYLFELSQSFNVFYGKHRIVDEHNSQEATEFRVLLVQAVAEVLAHGLKILGIKTSPRM